jgi:hypothetical protein
MRAGEASPYDPLLPILADLEAQIEKAAQLRLAPATGTSPGAAAPPVSLDPGAAERASAPGAPAAPGGASAPESAPAAAPVRRRLRRPHAPRSSRPRRSRLVVPRRALLLAALACLVGASATATVTVWSGDDAARDGRDLLAAGGTGTDEHRLELHAAGRRVCATFLLPDTVDTVCEPPPRGTEAVVRTVVSPFVRYVYGLTGSAAAAVAVEAGLRERSVRPRPVPADVVAGVPPARDLRWFLVELPRVSDDAPTVARIRPRQGAADAGGARVVVDCSLGQLDKRCDGG